MPKANKTCIKIWQDDKIGWGVHYVSLFVLEILPNLKIVFKIIGFKGCDRISTSKQ